MCDVERDHEHCCRRSTNMFSLTLFDGGKLRFDHPRHWVFDVLSAPAKLVVSYLKLIEPYKMH